MRRPALWGVDGQSSGLGGRTEDLEGSARVQWMLLESPTSSRRRRISDLNRLADAPGTGRTPAPSTSVRGQLRRTRRPCWLNQQVLTVDIDADERSAA
jgi:hypothetical protein